MDGSVSIFPGGHAQAKHTAGEADLTGGLLVGYMTGLTVTSRSSQSLPASDRGKHCGLSSFSPSVAILIHNPLDRH